MKLLFVASYEAKIYTIIKTGKQQFSTGNILKDFYARDREKKKKKKEEKRKKNFGIKVTINGDINLPHTVNSRATMNLSTNTLRAEI